MKALTPVSPRAGNPLCGRPLLDHCVRFSRSGAVSGVLGFRDEASSPKALVPLLAQLFRRNPAAPDMLLDILSDRGFSGSYILNERVMPARLNRETFEIENDVTYIHKFRCR